MTNSLNDLQRSALSLFAAVIGTGIALAAALPILPVA